MITQIALLFLAADLILVEGQEVEGHEANFTLGDITGLTRLEVQGGDIVYYVADQQVNYDTIAGTCTAKVTNDPDDPDDDIETVELTFIKKAPVALEDLL